MTWSGTPKNAQSSVPLSRHAMLASRGQPLTFSDRNGVAFQAKDKTAANAPLGARRSRKAKG